MADWSRARLIPVSGISSDRESEMRATSALLAVIEIVRDFSIELMSPLGANRSRKASVRCYTEVPFKVGDGKTTVRPDGLILIEHGKSKFTALVEVKTGSSPLRAEQINDYLNLARSKKYDAVITISNEIAAMKDSHPTEGVKVRSNSRVKLKHISWAAIQSMAEVLARHHGVEDPEQSWILHELIRYLRHPNSGANPFNDMGSDWVAVRDAARDRNLRRGDTAITDIAKRWDQLLRYASLRLEADIGAPVQQILPPSQRETEKRLKYLTENLVDDGRLNGSLRIKDTAGDVEIVADFRSRRVSISLTVAAPQDRGGRSRCTWLVNQLKREVDPNLMIESYAAYERTPVQASIESARADRDVLLDAKRRDPAKFSLVLSRDMGLARRSGGSVQSFIESVLRLINDFYESVVQDLKPWTPSAPKISRSTDEREQSDSPFKVRVSQDSSTTQDPDEDSGPEALLGDDSPPESLATLQADPWARIRLQNRLDH